MQEDDVRSRVASRIAGKTSPLPTSALGRQALLIAGLAGASARSIGRTVRRRVGRERPDIEPEAGVVESLGQLKGIATKIGQVLGYFDVGLPGTLRAALSTLQTNAQSLPAAHVRAVLEADLGDPGRRLADAMQPEAICSASVGQVHRSVLPDGTAVAVKVLHPHVSEIITRDFGPAVLAGRLASFFSRRAHLDAIVRQVQERILEECDYTLEAQRQARFAELFRGHPTLVVPEVHRAYSTPRILTTTFVRGVHLDAYLATRPAEKERTRVGEALFDFYAGALFGHGVYNCDPHPGNYLFLEGGRVAVVDFGCAHEFEPGCVGRLASLTRAVTADDRALLHDALVGVGLVDATAPYDADAARWLLRTFYGPLLRNEVLPFDLCAEAEVREVLRRTWRARGLTLSAELLFLLRTFFGLSSVLARLDVRANWRRRIEASVAESVAASAAVSRTASPQHDSAGRMPRPAARRVPSAEAFWDIVLLDAGASTIAVIRELRELTGMELRDVKSLVDAAPQVVRQALPRAEAETLRRRLETAGARVEVRRTS